MLHCPCVAAGMHGIDAVFYSSVRACYVRVVCCVACVSEYAKYCDTSKKNLKTIPMPMLVGMYDDAV